MQTTPGMHFDPGLAGCAGAAFYELIGAAPPVQTKPRVRLRSTSVNWVWCRRRVVMLDNHPQGPLDGLWAGVAAGGSMSGLADPWAALDGDSAQGTSGSHSVLALTHKLPLLQ